MTGTVGLEGFHVNPAFVLFGQTAMAEITADPVVLPDPFITIDHYGPPLGPPGAKFPSGSFYLSISDLQINGPIIGSYGGPGTIPARSARLSICPHRPWPCSRPASPFPTKHR